MFPQGISDQMKYHVFQASRLSMCQQLKIQSGLLAHWRHSQLRSRILSFLHFLNSIDELHLRNFEYCNLNYLNNSIIWFPCLLTDRREVIRMDGTRSEAASNLSVSTRPNWSLVNPRLDPVTQYSSDPGLDSAADPAGVRDQDQARIHHLNKRNDPTLQPTDSLWVLFVYLVICLFFLTLHSILWF